MQITQIKINSSKGQLSLARKPPLTSFGFDFLQTEHASVIYGTHFPNRLFAGCLPENATAIDLGDHFSRYGKVIEAKVLKDDSGRSKRFGFVSFHNESSVNRVLDERPIRFKGKVINVGPAVKKEGHDAPRNASPRTVSLAGSPMMDSISTQQINCQEPSRGINAVMISMTAMAAQPPVSAMSTAVGNMQAASITPYAMQDPMPPSVMQHAVPSSYQTPMQLPLQFSYPTYDNSWSFYGMPTASQYPEPNIYDTYLPVGQDSHDIPMLNQAVLPLDCYAHVDSVY